MKILINVVNARNVGGGLQVVHNFLLGTLKYPYFDVEWYYAVSECLDTVYLNDEFKSKVEGHYFVFPNQPDFFHTYRKTQKNLRRLENKIKPDVIYTILGPCYNFFKHREVIRFVHPWVVTSNPYAWSTLSFKTKVRMKFHIVLLKLLLKRIKYVITQTEAVKQGLIRELAKEPDSIRVVSNVLPALYASLDNTPIEVNSGWVEIPAIGGGEHKNLDIIPEVLKELEETYGIKNYRFHVTLPKSSPVLPIIEQRIKEFGYEDRLINHGNLKQQDLAMLYRKCRISYLPSVLEVFSASTTESMYFQLPTVATELFFNTEVFGDACLYYTPKDVKQAASQIVRAVTDESVRQNLKDKMKIQLTRFNCFEKYFNDTVEFLMEVGEGKHDENKMI